jgi:hypothetical protein
VDDWYGKTGNLKQQLGEWIRASNMQWNALTHRGQLFVKHDLQVLVHEASTKLIQRPTGKIASTTFKNEPYSVVTAMPKLSIPTRRLSVLIKLIYRTRSKKANQPEREKVGV